MSRKYKNLESVLVFITFAHSFKQYTMRTIKLLCILLMATTVLPVLARKHKDNNKYGVYLAGVSASFSDSLVYFTDIQYVDSASFDPKGLLNGRAQYSLQLKDYLEQKENLKNRTCFMFFKKKKKQLDKEMRKLRQKYQKGNTLVIKDLPDFKFTKAITE